MISGLKVTGVIPARYESSRFPGKPLAEIFGKSMIQRVVEQALLVPGMDEVLVVTDDQRIFDHIINLGHSAKLTSSHHRSGTDRIGEILPDLKADIIVNIQGDEPFIEPNMIRGALDMLIENDHFDISTSASPFSTLDEWHNPNRVKVLVSESGKALYFSRAGIPYDRSESLLIPQNTYKHIGLYCYKRKALEKILTLPAHAVELRESLEQLRFLMNDLTIGVSVGDFDSPAVDTPEDLEHILLNREG